jgi:hypothetical protein
MKPSLIKESVRLAIKAKKPIFIWGSPGIGKSDIVTQVANEEKLECRTCIAVLFDPVDLRGIPSIVNGRTVWARPGWLPETGEGVLFIDELPQAPPLVQNAFTQLILERRVGEHKLGDGWAVIAAGNREGDRAATYRMPTHLANRFYAHLTFDVDLEDWIAWALTHHIRTEIIAFLRFRSALLNNFDTSKNDKAFPTPRSWAFVSSILDQTPSKELEFELIAGAVGQGAATEFLGFLRIYRDLPDPDLIISNPLAGDIPEDPAILYALCGALATRVNPKNIDPIIKYAMRLPAEFSVMLVADAARRNPQIVKTKGFIDWSIKNQDVLI